jgi:methyl-accepting chemotaxis protein
MGQAWLSFTKVQEVHAKSTDIGTNWLPSVKSLGQVKFFMTRLRLNSARVAMTTDAALRIEAQNQTAAVATELAAEMKAYEILISSADERHLWTGFIEKMKVYEQVQKEFLNIALAGDMEAADGKFNTEAFRSFNDALAALDKDLQFNDRGARSALNEGEAIYGSAKVSAAIIATFALLIGLRSAFFVVSRVTSPIRYLNGAMTAIARGNLETEVPYTKRRDEIGDMAVSLQVFKDNIRHSNGNTAIGGGNPGDQRHDRKAVGDFCDHRLRCGRAGSGDSRDLAECSAGRSEYARYVVIF